VDIRLEPGLGAPGEARDALEVDDLPEDLLDDAKLLVSELVTNCIRHARLHPGQWIGVRARPTPCGLRLEVCDPGPGFPAPPPIPESLHPFGGRGLPIVARVASRWGAGRTRAGRWEVWLELDRPPAPGR
jgi:anti-sigma regulatory factor (Ser/Thr protein kinase)